MADNDFISIVRRITGTKSEEPILDADNEVINKVESGLYGTITSLHSKVVVLKEETAELKDTVVTVGEELWGENGTAAFPSANSALAKVGQAQKAVDTVQESVNVILGDDPEANDGKGNGLYNDVVTIDATLQSNYNNIALTTEKLEEVEAVGVNIAKENRSELLKVGNDLLDGANSKIRKVSDRAAILDVISEDITKEGNDSSSSNYSHIKHAADNAKVSTESANLSRSWAVTAEDIEVEAGLFSSRHYSEKSKEQADLAKGYKELTDKIKDDTVAVKADVVSLKADTQELVDSMHTLSVDADSVSPDSNAEALYDSDNNKLVIRVPRGARGLRGESFRVNAQGSAAGRDDYDDESIGFSYLNVEDGELYFKDSDDSGDWSDPIIFGKGDTGETGVGIKGIEFDSTTDDSGDQGVPGATDTFNLLLTDDSKLQFSVTNGTIYADTQVTELLENKECIIANKDISALTNTVISNGKHVKAIANADLVKGQLVKRVGYDTTAKAVKTEPVDSVSEIGIGVVTVDVANGDEYELAVDMVLVGLDTSAYVAGTELYNAWDGTLTDSKDESNFQLVAIVLKSDDTNGQLQVTIGELTHNYTHPDHTGDVTSTSDGATVIANKAVSYDKMQDVAAASILGNKELSSGITQELTAEDVRTLLNVEDGATADQTGAEIKVAYEGEDDTNAYTDEAKGKVDYLTVTDAVDLDSIKSRVGELGTAVVLSGNWDASSGNFPSSTITGQSWVVSVEGTVDNIKFNVNDRIMALVDNASTDTYVDNWLKLNYAVNVSTVNNKVGEVVLDGNDIEYDNSDTELDTTSDVNTLQSAIVALDKGMPKSTEDIVNNSGFITESINTINFNNVLSSTDDTIQKALDKLDDKVIPVEITEIENEHLLVWDAEDKIWRNEVAPTDVEKVQDIVGDVLNAGTNVTFELSDGNNNIAINAIQRGIDDIPVENEIEKSITSNWAYKHSADGNNHVPTTDNAVDGQVIKLVDGSIVWADEGEIDETAKLIQYPTIGGEDGIVTGLSWGNIDGLKADMTAGKVIIGAYEYSKEAITSHEFTDNTTTKVYATSTGVEFIEDDTVPDKSFKVATVDASSGSLTIINSRTTTAKLMTPEQIKVVNGIEATTDGLKIVTGTTTKVRYDKILSSLDIIALEKDGDGNLVKVRYTNDGDTEAPYYRDEMEYDSNGNLVKVKHYYNTDNLNTPSGTTELTYTDGELSSTSYTE